MSICCTPAKGWAYLCYLTSRRRRRARICRGKLKILCSSSVFYWVKKRTVWWQADILFQCFWTVDESGLYHALHIDELVWVSSGEWKKKLAQDSLNFVQTISKVKSQRVTKQKPTHEQTASIVSYRTELVCKVRRLCRYMRCAYVHKSPLCGLAGTIYLALAP